MPQIRIEKTFVTATVIEVTDDEMTTLRGRSTPKRAALEDSLIKKAEGLQPMEPLTLLSVTGAAGPDQSDDGHLLFELNPDCLN